jgi:ribosomal-protein-alanine N-acetyltransferase
MDYALRAATAADADRLAELEYELFPDNNFNEVTLCHEILQGVTWVALVEDTIVGYALCRMGNGRLLDILRLGVLGPFRRLGIASALLESATRASGHQMLTVRKGNDPAIALYQKHGFHITGSMPQHYAWVMQLRTTSA